MKHSPLQLVRYLVTETNYSANPNFKPDKDWVGAIESFSVESTVNRLAAEKDFPGHSWSVEMVISQKLQAEQNFPYKFQVNLVGMFACNDKAFDEGKENEFVRVNGSSMLYGIAREIVRSLTAAGPWGQIVLPTISFYDNETKPKEQSAPVPKAD